MEYINFVNYMAEHGIVIAGNQPITADGKIHRFTVEGDKKGSKNGWYVLYGSKYLLGLFGCWRRNVQYKWHENHHLKLDEREKKEFHQQLKVLQLKAKQTQLERQHNAAVECGVLWESAKMVDSHHSYLLKKQITPTGIKQLKQTLLIPVTNHVGQLTSIQSIYPDGKKRFYPGGKIQGCWHQIGDIGLESYLTEGWATGKSINQYTGKGVVVCFHAGNIKSVALALSCLYPLVKWVIAADNDHQRDDNPGLTKAREASSLTGFSICYPQFHPSDRGTDFNDIAVNLGISSLIAQLNQVEGASHG